MKHWYFIFSILLFTSFYYQKPMEPTVPVPPQYPQGYFASPVAGEMVLSGSFGELRKNHFHAGIDIAPTRSGNEPIFAAAEGYVLRVKAEENGYGQSVYVAHPNGYTTVYGHVNSFSNEILAILRKKQYETENFQQDLMLQPTDIPVRQGQQIATMGNRGQSAGQHLHFEIRETQTEKAVNPLLFGFHVPDNVPPRFADFKVYLLDDKKEVIGTRYIDLVRKSPGIYAVKGDTIDVGAPNVAFALETTDIQGDDSGQNGIFSLALQSDGETVYQFKAEKFGFDETRYLNAHVDYNEYYVRKIFFHRMFRLCGDMLSMYDSLRNDGMINLSMPSNTEGVGNKQITLTAADIAGNVSTCSFILRAKPQTIQSVSKPYTYFFPYDKESVIKPDDNAIFYFPKGSFYENVYARFGVTPTEGGQYSPTYQLHEVRTPIQYDFRIAIKPQNLPDSLRNKAFIAYCTRENGESSSCGGTWDKDGFLTTKNSKFGNYAIEIDQTPPTITPSNFGEKIEKTSRLSFKIKDNIEGRPLRYRAEIDGQWILMEMDGKSDMLFCRFQDLPSPLNTEGDHKFKLTLTDDRDNIRVFERNIELVDHIERPKPKSKPKSKKKKH